MPLKPVAKIYLDFIVKFFLKCLALGISYCIPKSNQIWIFGGWFGERFADNSRYFYLYCHYNKQKLGLNKVIWVTRNPRVYRELKARGCEVYKIWSIPSIWYHLRGRVHIIDQSFRDINDIFSVRSKIINLWHGFPLKKIGRYCTNTQEENILIREFFKNNFANLNIKINEKNYYLLTTSEFSAEILGQAFGLKRENMLLAGYPRNDIFQLDNPDGYVTESEQVLLTKIKKIKNRKKIVVYLPTFRDNQGINPPGMIVSKERYALNDYLGEHNILLITKFHFAEKGSSPSGAIDLDNMINLPPEFDVYPLLKFADLLITDYSSIYFDFLFAQKPIIFYPYDLEYYAHKDRGFIFDYQEYTPGPKVYTLTELQEAILQSLNVYASNDKYIDHREFLRNKIFDSSRIPGSKYLADEIKKKVLME